MNNNKIDLSNSKVATGITYGAAAVIIGICALACKAIYDIASE